MSLNDFFHHIHKNSNKLIFVISEKNSYMNVLGQALPKSFVTVDTVHVCVPLMKSWHHRSFVRQSFCLQHVGDFCHNCLVVLILLQLMMHTSRNNLCQVLHQI